MIDLHTHTVFSDGELIPYELVRRAEAAGLTGIAITDHVDASNLDLVVPRVAKAVKRLREHTPLKVIAVAELTHIPPRMLRELVREAREAGAELVLVHGETLVEPVIEGTNRAGIEAGADIISHPGLISAEDVTLALEKGVALEITARKWHSLANGHVVRQAARYGARLVINTDAHAPGDLMGREAARRVLLGAGLGDGYIEAVFETSRNIVEKILG
jgi:histidinol phosphatase-like PHP family hydrolase